MSAVIEESRPGTRAKVRFVRMSASKVRVVLNLIRGKQVSEAIEILSFSERLAAKEVLKALNSAVANAEHNEEIPEEELFISACFADEGPTLKRFRPRARGRAGRIHKQTCHITIEVSRLTDEEIDELRNRSELKSATREKTRGKKSSGGDRAKRVAKSRAAAASDEAEDVSEDEAEDTAAEDVADATSSDEEAPASDRASDEEASASDEEASASDGAADGAADSEDAEGTTESEAGEEE